MLGGSRRIVQGEARVDGRESGCDEQVVAVAQRDVEPFGEMQHHPPAGHRPAAFEKAQMPLRYVGLQGQIQLAEAPALPPHAQVAARCRRRRLQRHVLASGLAPRRAIQGLAASPRAWVRCPA